MKKQSFLLFGTITVLLVILFSGCKKSIVAANSQFIGTYTGTTTESGTGNLNDQIVITAGANPNAILLTETLQSLAGNATVSGNNFTLVKVTIPNNNGDTITYTGSGTINGNTLTAVIIENGTQSGTNQLNFTGTK